MADAPPAGSIQALALTVLQTSDPTIRVWQVLLSEAEFPVVLVSVRSPIGREIAATARFTTPLTDAKPEWDLLPDWDVP